MRVYTRISKESAMSIPIYIWIMVLVAATVLVAAVGRATHSRAVVVALTVWGVVVTALAAAGIVAKNLGGKAPLLGVFVVLPIVAVVVAYFLSKRLRALLAGADLTWLVGAHTM